MSDTPLQPDAIRLRPGEQQQLTNPAKFRYVTRADCTCAEEIHFDQFPPDKCKHRHWFYLDQDYEAAKRVTAESVIAKLNGQTGVSRLPSTGTRSALPIYTTTPQLHDDIDSIFSTTGGADS